ncbi:MAG: helix-turn-helix domain-containing protein [Armatimonadota bacterium]|nr:helix-turn-helix domain-containing protein [Armatimonadota bacterium]
MLLLLTMDVVSVIVVFMETLGELKEQDAQYSLDRLVELANRLLPRCLPEEKYDARMRVEVSPRLVRHLTTLGVLDDAIRQGREARYTYRHLVQLLVARRLMAEGYSAAASKRLIAGQDSTKLEAFLSGGAQVTVDTSQPAAAEFTVVEEEDRLRIQETNPALEYISKLRESQAGTGAGRRNPAPAPQLTPAPAPVRQEPPQRWTHIRIQPALELHVREDFILPSSPQERDALLQVILQQLKHSSARRR